ncbi:MAG: Jag N-terminal domain-containing protein [Elusimicrobiota bacterium]
MREIKIEAKTTKEAIEKGLMQLGVTREQVEVEIIREEKRGILGIGSQDACVIIREKIWGEAHENKKEKKTEIPLEEGFKPSGSIIEDVKKIFSDILSKSKIDFKILEEAYDESKSTVYLNFQSKDAGLLLYDGAKGLLSLQQIVSIIINKDPNKKIVVRLDTEEFWNKTENRIKRDVEHAIDFINRTRRPYRMKPMPSTFRKIVHDIVHEKYPEYSTFSQGHGRFRRVVIRYPKKQQTKDSSGQADLSQTTEEKKEEATDNQNVQSQ